jgi:hypothetical protein
MFLRNSGVFSIMISVDFGFDCLSLQRAAAVENTVEVVVGKGCLKRLGGCDYFQNVPCKT